MKGEVSMFYQLEYDKVFVVDEFYYEEKDVWIDGLSLDIRFDHVFQSNSEECEDQTIQLTNERSSLCSLVRVSYDKRTKLVSFHAHKEIADKYKVVRYYMYTCPEPTPDKEVKELSKEEINRIMEMYRKGEAEPKYGGKEISKDEFYFLINKYGTYINNDSSLQNCSYGWHEIKEVDPNTVIQNSNKKHSNSLIQRLEQSLINEKEKHEEALENRHSATDMKHEYRGESLRFMNIIEQLNNQKDFLLNQERYEQDKILEIYVQLINEWSGFTKFIARKEIYNYRK